MANATVQNCPCFCAKDLVAVFAARHSLELKAAMAKLLRHGVWPERFRRNYGLLSEHSQAVLLNLPIFIAGCGGLGGEIGAMLARLGAGNIRLCDYDSFEESNLNRQRFCLESSLGEKKAEVMAQGLAAIAPWGDYQPLVCKLDAENLPELLRGCAIVIDCLDSVQGKAMLEKAAQQAGIAWLHGAVLHQEGFVCLGDPATGIINQLYNDSTRESGAGTVLTNVVAGTAALMCSLFVKWLNGQISQTNLLHADFSVPELEYFHLFSQTVAPVSAVS